MSLAHRYIESWHRGLVSRCTGDGEENEVKVKGRNAMPTRWYYQNQGGAVGPVSAAELRFLLATKKIDASTLARGDDGDWVPANTIDELSDRVERAGVRDVLDHQEAVWHLSGKDQKKLGPVSRDVLEEMACEGRLEPDDLIWKPGMAAWVPASQVAGLFETSRRRSARKAGFFVTPRSRGHRRILWAAAAILVFLGLFATVAGWKWARIGSPNADPQETAREKAMRANVRVNGGPVNAGGPLDEAMGAVRAGQLDRAARLLDQYLNSPSADQSEAARLLQREVELATSSSKALTLAKSLGDDQLRAYLRQGVESLVASMSTLELRPFYEQTLLQAFRQENGRRQFVPRIAEPGNAERGPMHQRAENEGPEQNRPPAKEPTRPQADAHADLIGQAGPAARGPLPHQVVNADDDRADGRGRPIATNLDDVLDKPALFAARTITFKGLFKIGTRVGEVKGPRDQTLGWSLPVARNDESTVCAGDSKVKNHDVYLLLEDGLAPFLERVFKKLGMAPTMKPTYKSILTAQVRRMLVDGGPKPVVVITSLEILGGCNYLAVARHQYAQAFKTLRITRSEAFVDFGDGDDWVERLGGEERFVDAVRSKLRDLRRRAATNRDRELVDRIIQSELSKAISAGIAYNQIRAMEAMMRTRILP
jgi:GYF domain 2